jgi:hypothetical protein
VQPLDERSSELGLQGGELLGQRRLGDMQAARRPREVALVDDGDEVQELAKGDRARLTIAHGYRKNSNWGLDGISAGGACCAGPRRGRRREALRVGFWCPRSA